MRNDLSLLFNLRYAIFIEKIRHNLNMVLILKFHTYKMEIELHSSLICKYRKIKKSIFVILIQMNRKDTSQSVIESVLKNDLIMAVSSFSLMFLYNPSFYKFSYN